jgi:hypothetical protein
MANDIEITWLTDPEDDDYPAAGSYLSLLYDDTAAAAYVDQLRKASLANFKAKDIFRASGLPLLGVSNSHVEHDQNSSRCPPSIPLRSRRRLKFIDWQN